MMPRTRRTAPTALKMVWPESVMYVQKELLGAILIGVGNALDDEEDDASGDELNAEANEVACNEVLRREARIADDAADAGAAPGEEAPDREVARRVDGGLDDDRLLRGHLTVHCRE